MSDNNISIFAPALLPQSPLLTLDLHANSLTSFPAAEVAGKRYLQHINIARNAMEGAEVGKDVSLPAVTWMNLNGGVAVALTLALEGWWGWCRRVSWSCISPLTLYARACVSCCGSG